MDRASAIAILKEIGAQGDSPSMVSLVNVHADSYELHIKPQVLTVDAIKQIAEKHNVKFREDKGLVIFF